MNSTSTPCESSASRRPVGDSRVAGSITTLRPPLSSGPQTSRVLASKAGFEAKPKRSAGPNSA